MKRTMPTPGPQHRLGSHIGRPGHRGVSYVGMLWMLCCVAGAGWLLAGAQHAGPAATPQNLAHAVSDGVAADVPAPVPTDSYLPIEQVTVGQRVVTPETDLARPTPTEVDPATWKRVSLRLDQRWPDGTNDPVHVESLQPPRWVTEQNAQPGQWVLIPPDLEELGLTGGPHDRLEVTAVGPCPPLRPGPGRVVLATLTHLSRSVFDLEVTDVSGRHEILRPTGIHRFWSECRSAWVRTDALRVGEPVRGRDGPLWVVSARPRPGVERVYNLTVESEHLYYVTESGLLTHNAGSSPSGPGRTLNDDLPRDKGGRTIVPDPAAQGSPHTVVGTRTEPTISPEPYRQGVTFDENGNPTGRTDVTDHGRSDHVNPHFHPWNGTKFTNPSLPIPPWEDKPGG